MVIMGPGLYFIISNEIQHIDADCKRRETMLKLIPTFVGKQRGPLTEPAQHILTSLPLLLFRYGLRPQPDIFNE